MDDPNRTLPTEPTTKAGVPTAATLRAEAGPPTSQHGSETVVEVADFLPHLIGRYRVERLLGRGGFGIVYLAHDEQLQRFVAIKVPHRKLIARPQDADPYLVEARTVANLDHPNIVPVYDVGSTREFPCFVVSKFIEGSTLSRRLREGRLPVSEAVELTAAVAEALHHAHTQGLVHRDIKPGNILIDKSGKPFVGDFGVALREQDIGKGSCYAGTPAYMSPEQARGEGHRVDGRSDIFSLGVVLYELLTGRLPFRADSTAELMDQVANREPVPLRQIEESIPKELERICLKAMSKRISERYRTAQDMAEDLRYFLAELATACKSATPQQQGSKAGRVFSETPTLPTPHTAVSQFAQAIVPKGLRSFDAADADFFLELLPGPQDRDGLPESIRFWKNRIETSDADSTFDVGLIYGPSGCGKSSMVKAGLLPRLAKFVTVVYVEATGEETEARLLKSLRRQVTDLPGNLGLIESLAALRQGRFLQAEQKILIVVDQFEQWLHAKQQESNVELIQALRQCDGGRVQCLVMVRDDFGMAVARFMRALEIPVVEGANFVTVDLFDLIHARKVLAAFGRAYGRLPGNLSQCGKEQNAFLKKAVADLSQNNKVIPVRLALFAEMVKGKPWTPATLTEVGGAEGVGFIFLEETFIAPTASPQHRLHQEAAQAVLKALLPEAGSNIRGQMRSRQELLEASGYASQPRDFEELLRILDSELRLITPTDPEGKGEGPTSLLSGEHYYQLTHDYLVPSLRDWLTRKQKETRRGRAELLLADRAAVWSARQENRQLPSLVPWLQIHWHTKKKNWNEPQRRMMRRATRYHAVRGLALALTLLFVAATGLMIRSAVLEQHRTNQAQGIVHRLLDADIDQVPAIISEIESSREWTDPLLREENGKARTSSRQKLNLSLALLPVDPDQTNYLYRRLLIATPNEAPVIRDALDPHKQGLLDKLWTVAEAPEKGKEGQRLRAATALAAYAPESQRWDKIQQAVANDLVTVPPVYLALWMDSLRPVRAKVLTPLSAIYRDANRRETERSLATDILADYAANNIQVLADLLMDADDKQFAVIFPNLQAHGERGLPLLMDEIHRTLPFDLPSSDEKRERLAKRQANAAAALLRMDQPEPVWPLLKHSPDPRTRSYLIHRLSSLGADAGAIIKRLDQEPDLTIRRALILSLGEYGEKALPREERQALLPKLQNIYRTAADPGLHAAVEWLLRAWNQEAWLKQVNEEWAKDTKQRAERLKTIKQALAKEKTPQWHVNSRGHTMVVIPGPVEFVMGSPLTEAHRETEEIPHKKRIGRTFALAATAVTVGQYRQFDKDYHLPALNSYTMDLPVVQTSWHQAAAYCNWLSKEEGIAEDQWCYEITNERMAKLKPNYLSLTGYRLPTEAEAQYANRAGALTSRFFGESEELLPKYAWYVKNSQDKTWPVGRLKPNDLGLFDVQGNVYTWCQETYRSYRPSQAGGPEEDKEDVYSIDNKIDHMLSGGSFLNQATFVRAAIRPRYLPTSNFFFVGFRPARTIVP